MNEFLAKYGAVILAAGNSSRLGQPKQLVKFRDQTLLNITVSAATSAVGKQTIIVTGAHRGLLAEELRHLPVHIIHNPYWQEGMSSSICYGLINLLKIFPYLDGVIFLVCDQPFISAALLKIMISEQDKTGKNIIPASYNNTTGVPVLFTYKYFSNLINLKGNEGAKSLLKEFPEDMATVDFPEGAIDIDTAEDYANLLSIAN